jgi:hypothetical protein
MSKSLLLQYAEVFDPNLGLFRNGGPNFFPIRHIINLQKGGSFLFMLSLMIYFNNFSIGAWVYLALHGSYGIKKFI